MYIINSQQVTNATSRYPIIQLFKSEKLIEKNKNQII